MKIPVQVWVGAGALAGVALLAWIVANYGKGAGQAIGRGAGEAAAGVIVGLGESFGLPDTSDAVVVTEGRAALERGEYFEASKKLPALDFLGGIGSNLGLWAYDVLHPNEFGEADQSAGLSSSITHDVEGA